MTPEDFLALGHAIFTVVAVFAIVIGIGWCIAQALEKVDE